MNVESPILLLVLGFLLPFEISLWRFQPTMSIRFSAPTCRPLYVQSGNMDFLDAQTMATRPTLDSGRDSRMRDRFLRVEIQFHVPRDDHEFS